MEGLNSKNFVAMSKLIEQNKIAPNLVEASMKQEIERNRTAFAFPANVGAAMLHRQAVAFGYRRNLKGQLPTVCPCCLVRVDGEPLPLCYNTTESSVEVAQNYEEFKLQPGVSMYFSFLKSATIYILLLALCFAYSAYRFSGCQFSDVYLSIGLPFCSSGQPNPPNGSNYFDLTSILGVASVAVALLFLIVYRRIRMSSIRQFCSKHQSQDSYSVMISNIPVLDFPKKNQNQAGSTEFFYRKHLEQFLEQRVKKWVEDNHGWADEDSNEGDYLQMLKANQDELKSREIVKSISLCYNLNRLEIIDDATKRLIEEKSHLEEQEDNRLIEEIRESFHQDRFSTVPKRVQFMNDCRVVLNKQFGSDNSLLFNLTHFSGIALVSFQYQHYRNFFLEAFRSNNNCFIYNGNVLEITQAPHPKDVFWKNLRWTNAEKRRLHWNTFFAILLVLTVSFLILLVVNLLFYGINALVSASFTQTPNVFIIVASVVILITQALLRKWIDQLVIAEKHKSHVNESTSYMAKCAVAQTLAAIIPLFLLNFLLGKRQDLHFYFNNFMLWSAVREILQGLIQPTWIWREVRRWWRYRKSKREDQVDKFQFELNEQCARPEYQIRKRCTYYIYKAFVCGFFAYEAPLSLVISAIELILMYWIDKNNLFSRCSLTITPSIAESNYAFRLLRLSLLIFATLLFVMSSLSIGQINWFTGGAFILALVYSISVVLKPRRFERCLFGRKTVASTVTFDDWVAEGKFSQTYWSENPATCLVEEGSVTGKEMVTNPALLRRFGDAKDYESLM